MNQACRTSMLKLWEKQSPDGQPDLIGQHASHAGLLLDRFLRAADDEGSAKRQILEQALKAAKQSYDLYHHAFDRWQQHLRKLQEVSNQPLVEMQLAVQGRSIIGLGSESVLETGITLHRIYGVPLLPGSALKGLASHYCDQVWSGGNAEFKREGDFGEGDQKEKRPGHYYKELFGATDDSGHIIFHDAWIKPESLVAENQGLVLDVMTPHHSDYYMAGAADNNTAPTDFDSPIPIPFLSVAGTFHIAIACDISGERGKKWVWLALTLLRQALANWGIGGKTNAGYGRMIDLSQAVTQPSSLGEGGPAASASSGPRFKPGDKVSAKRVEDPKGRKRIWFQAEDGVGGVVARGVPPQVEVGKSVSLWIVSASKDTYNFSNEAPQPPRNPPKKGRRAN